MGIIISLSLIFASCEAQKKREAAKKKELLELEATLVPLRFRVLERENGTIKAEFNFYSVVSDNIDEDDMEALFAKHTPIASRTFDLRGKELFIDCLKFQEKQGLFFKHDVNWVFPYRVFTDEIAPDNADTIYSYYDKEGFPRIYEDFSLDAKAKQHLSGYFSDIKQYGSIKDSKLQKQITGNALHDMSKIARFKVGAWYDLAVHIKKGTIEYIEE
jgi:hypothetical protein